ncbi:MAG: PAS domain S-box protein [Verrucomicrobiota bacterium]
MNNPRGAKHLEGGLAVSEIVQPVPGEPPLPVNARKTREAKARLRNREVEDERVWHEGRFRASEQRFRDLFEGSPDAIFVEDLAGIVLDVNPAGCRLHGFTPEEMRGKHVLELVPPESRAEVTRGFKALTQGKLERFEGASWTKDGRAVPVEVRASLIDYAGKPAALLHVRDITERKLAEAALRESEAAQRRLEEQLRQSQKMEAIGQLAGGVAHDFNNIITVIHGYAALLSANATLTGVAARSAEEIVRAAGRASTLTRQLLAFSRRQVMQPRRLDMNHVVSNVTKMLGRLLGGHIVLQVSSFRMPALVEADAGMIEQVLVNLAVNARDAMPKGGTLGIRISVREVHVNPLNELAEARDGRFVCLAVSDEGCGIPQEHLSRIFEPFFTTKEIGKGTGLGLATVHGIVKQHQGWIEVESQLDKGTTFHVFLPGANTTPEPAESSPPPDPALRGGTETILLVEDDAPVREFVGNLLASHGYNVVQAQCGPEALEVWEQCRGQVDLLMTDLMMPYRLNGRELAEKLWAQRPGLKVLFTSGYNTELVDKDFILRPGINFLPKPYHPRKLALAVRACLDPDC